MTAEAYVRATTRIALALVAGAALLAWPTAGAGVSRAIVTGGLFGIANLLATAWLTERLLRGLSRRWAAASGGAMSAKLLGFVLAIWIGWRALGLDLAGLMLGTSLVWAALLVAAWVQARSFQRQAPPEGGSRTGNEPEDEVVV